MEKLSEMFGTVVLPCPGKSTAIGKYFEFKEKKMEDQSFARPFDLSVSVSARKSSKLLTGLNVPTEFECT